MYYILLGVGVFSLLTLAAWIAPTPQPFAIAPRRPAQGSGTQALGAAGDFVARLLQGKREDKPCITPVDCVRTGKCAGHCGWR